LRQNDINAQLVYYLPRASVNIYNSFEMSTKEEKERTENQDNIIQDDASEQASQAADSGTYTSGNDTDSSENSDGALTELQEKYDSLNDKYLRLYSEFDNYRRRTAKEKLEANRIIAAQIVKEFLPVVDDFDRAITGNETDNEIESIKEGFKLIHNKLFRILESNGVKPMNALEQPFDTEFHEAITNIAAPDPSLKGKVVDVAEKGYFYHDAVLRYAKVVVGQ
jgi:molecular chaperone GrpE